jgi:hypothetical protein
LLSTLHGITPDLRAAQRLPVVMPPAKEERQEMIVAVKGSPRERFPGFVQPMHPHVVERPEEESREEMEEDDETEFCEVCDELCAWDELTFFEQAVVLEDGRHIDAMCFECKLETMGYCEECHNFVPMEDIIWFNRAYEGPEGQQVLTIHYTPSATL